MACATATASGIESGDQNNHQTFNPSHAAVVAAHPLAVEAGWKILHAGGNAFDAAIAIATTLGVVEPYGSGLAGGGFWLIGEPSPNSPGTVEDQPHGFSLETEPQRQILFLDARETAPGQLDRTLLLDAEGQPNPAATLDSALGAGIPGIPAALAWLDERGTLDRATLLEPAITAAVRGFPVTARFVQMSAYRAEALAASPAAVEIFQHLRPRHRDPHRDRSAPLSSSVTEADPRNKNAMASTHPGSDSRPLAVGDVLTQPDLAKTLQLFAEQGFNAFYRGEFAQRMVSGVRSIGGLWTLDDLHGYRLQIRPPLYHRAHLAGREIEIVTAPLPSSGGLVLLEMLAVLADPDEDATGERPPKPRFEHTTTFDIGDADAVDFLAETMRLAYAARAGALGDPDFLAARDAADIAAWLTPERLSARRAAVIERISRPTRNSNDLLEALLNDGPERRARPPRAALSPMSSRKQSQTSLSVDPSISQPISDPRNSGQTDDASEDDGAADPRRHAHLPAHAFTESPQTTHFAVVDQNGRFVAATLTLNLPFGSGQVVPGTGLLLNNQLDDFATAPGVPNVYGLIGFEANALEPGKRPLSSMTPTLVRTPDADWLLGSPGGSRIITTVLHGVLGAIADQADPKEVVSAARFHHQFLPDRIESEPGAFSADLIRALHKRGHRLRIVPRPWGELGVIRIQRRDGRTSAAADPRTDADARP
ncbi:MAG: gamma-glutamyltransferase family protein [Thioalkalivibrionaceae bacterium]